MIIADYSDSGQSSVLSQLDDNYPFVFQKEYAYFLKEKLNSNLIFIISDCLKTFLAVRLYKIKFFSFAQILYPPLKEAKRLAAMEERDFLHESIRLIKEKKICQRIVQPPNYAIFHASPEGSVRCSFGSYFLNLQGLSDEELFTRLKNRTEIRHAENKGVIIKYGQEQLPVFYELYRQTMKRTGMSCEPFSYFEKFYIYLTDAKAICAVAYYQDQPQGALFMPYTRYAAYYLYGASAGHISVNGTIDYLHWQVIKSLKARGVKRYDFVGARLSDISGTKLDGIQRFKAKFGSDLEKGYLWKTDVHKTYAKLFDTLLRFKLMFQGKSPPQDLIEQELIALNRTR